MRAGAAWVTDANVALLTDQYELTMMQAYWRERMFADAVFTLFVRRLPESRNFLLACGLDDVLHYLENLRFSQEAIAWLRTRPEFEAGFVDWLSGLRFTGDVRAVAEGTPVFANEPLLEVRAPLPEAQLVETVVMNQVQLQTLLASKAVRVVLAARGRQVVDFGLRRMHGTDAGLKAARAFHIAGVHATSNVLAGMVYGVPVAGTMAHSYVQAHDAEMDAFRAFARQYREPVLLVDTYDTLDGVRNVIRLATELGDAFNVRAVRLDSGDLGALAIASRALLDEAGLNDLRIFASGGLDEYEIERLLGQGAPIDGFGVGSAMAVATDAPVLDIAYKLAEYAGHGRLKLSPGKPILPGPKQVYRLIEDGVAVRDVIARAGERLPGEPLLETVMKDGHRLGRGDAGTVVDAARARAAERVARLSPELRSIAPPERPYTVKVSEGLRALQAELAHEVEEAQ